MGDNGRVLLRVLLGHRLRMLRLQRGMSLRELARLARVSMAHLSEIERGKAEPSSEILAAICDGLGIDLLELLSSLVEEPTALPLAA